MRFYISDISLCMSTHTYIRKRTLFPINVFNWQNHVIKQLYSVVSRKRCRTVERLLMFLESNSLINYYYFSLLFVFDDFFMIRFFSPDILGALVSFLSLLLVTLLSSFSKYNKGKFRSRLFHDRKRVADQNAATRKKKKNVREN